MNITEDLLVDLIGLVVMAGVPGYFVLQAWLPRRLAGGWRRAALMPLGPMGAVLAYTVFAFIDGSNLFPLVLIFTAPLAFIYLLIVIALRWLNRPPAGA